MLVESIVQQAELIAFKWIGVTPSHISTQSRRRRTTSVYLMLLARLLFFMVKLSWKHGNLQQFRIWSTMSYISCNDPAQVLEQLPPQFLSIVLHVHLRIPHLPLTVRHLWMNRSRIIGISQHMDLGALSPSIMLVHHLTLSTEVRVKLILLNYKETLKLDLTEMMSLFWCTSKWLSLPLQMQPRGTESCGAPQRSTEYSWWLSSEFKNNVKEEMTCFVESLWTTSSGMRATTWFGNSTTEIASSSSFMPPGLTGVIYSILNELRETDGSTIPRHRQKNRALMKKKEQRGHGT